MNFELPVDPTIIEALEKNLWALWRRFGLGSGCSLHEDEGATWFETPIGHLPYNGVLRFRSDEASAEIDQQIDAVFDHFGRRDVPFFWLVHPTALPTDLDRRLEARGLVEVESFPGMVVALDAVPQAVGDAPQGIEIREVTDPKDRDSILELIAWRWDVPQEARGLLPDVSSDFDVGQPGSSIRCWLAWKDGKPVSKVVLNITGEVCGIYGVATRPEARGLGLAREMTLLACQAARGAGSRLCVLHSTEMALNLYRKIGFREQNAIFRLFCRPGSLHM
ncbi:GNAT family N-acetyltransferase [Puniceicoccales bacterium CK1056]|uniref:GNAT family N-acetyltransferase n=1 Tax=Oceanipulchritudo coccoides TaxID=2706888 RepID=A0A6B2LZS2_9BACT|nr:GNAT family N-acetyltransferase [Oceanipulchritudo coccoides]NDV61652.1 GNAT family N-acetyltransferase [Oceanipulchritudo coccoides]